MKLWLLKPAAGARDKQNSPWEPWYDKTFGLVVRAETETAAREAAQIEVGDEFDGHKNVWINPEWVDCTELTTDGDAQIVLKDFWSA